MNFKFSYIDLILFLLMLVFAGLFFYETKKLKEISDENASQADSLYMITVQQQAKIERLKLDCSKLAAKNDSIIDKAIELTKVKITKEDKNEAIEWLKHQQY
jgi:hypothetical protein